MSVRVTDNGTVQQLGYNGFLLSVLAVTMAPQKRTVQPCTIMHGRVTN